MREEIKEKVSKFKLNPFQRCLLVVFTIIISYFIVGSLDATFEFSDINSELENYVKDISLNEDGSFSPIEETEGYDVSVEYDPEEEYWIIEVSKPTAEHGFTYVDQEIIKYLNLNGEEKIEFRYESEKDYNEIRIIEIIISAICTSILLFALYLICKGIIALIIIICVLIKFLFEKFLIAANNRDDEA